VDAFSLLGNEYICIYIQGVLFGGVKKRKCGISGGERGERPDTPDHLRLFFFLFLFFSFLSSAYGVVAATTSDQDKQQGLKNSFPLIDGRLLAVVAVDRQTGFSNGVTILSLLRVQLFLFFFFFFFFFFFSVAYISRSSTNIHTPSITQPCSFSSGRYYVGKGRAGRIAKHRILCAHTYVCMYVCMYVRKLRASCIIHYTYIHTPTSSLFFFFFVSFLSRIRIYALKIS
jgi:hypothetical protein